MSRVGSILRVITRSLLAFTVFIPTTWVGLFATDHLVAHRGLWPEVLDSWLWWVILGVPVLSGIAAAVLVDRVLRRMRERSRVLVPGR